MPQVSVPQLMVDAGFDQLDLLHCDTRGAETEILTSCPPLLERGAIRFCMISTHHHLIAGDALTHECCLQLVKAARGLILVRHSVAESFSGDGSIVAYFGTDPIYLPKIHLSYNRTSTSVFRDALFDLADARGQR
jgi:DNA-binding transcriptional LysR family regulator